MKNKKVNKKTREYDKRTTKDDRQIYAFLVEKFFDKEMRKCQEKTICLCDSDSGIILENTDYFKKRLIGIHDSIKEAEYYNLAHSPDCVFLPPPYNNKNLIKCYRIFLST